VISALDPDPRRPGAVRVAVAGAVYCTVPEAVARAEGLKLGQAVDDALHERLFRAADAEAAFRAALRSLEARPYAGRDLGRRLVKKGHPQEAADAALERLVGLGLLDDAAFARNYVQSRAARGRGPARVTRDLVRMGVDRESIDQAVAQEWEGESGRDRGEMTVALVERRAAQLGELPRPVKRRRLLAFLARRGFTGREAIDAVQKAVE
jgi:regulatory protein